MAQVTLASSLTIRGLDSSRASRTRFSVRARVSTSRRTVLCTAKGGEENEFVKNRTENQKRLASIDGAVRQAQKDLGKTILSNFEGPLKALGIGKKSGRPKTGKNQWEEQREYLLGNTNSVSATEVMELMEKGYIFLDVRPNDEYEAFHPVGAKSVPLYQTIEGASAKQLVRKSLYAMQAVKPVEENPDFIEQAKAFIGDAPGVAVGCSAGGTLQYAPPCPIPSCPSPPSRFPTCPFPDQGASM